MANPKLSHGLDLFQRRLDVDHKKFIRLYTSSTLDRLGGKNQIHGPPPGNIISTGAYPCEETESKEIAAGVQYLL